MPLADVVAAAEAAISSGKITRLTPFLAFGYEWDTGCGCLVGAALTERGVTSVAPYASLSGTAAVAFDVSDAGVRGLMNGFDRSRLFRPRSEDEVAIMEEGRALGQAFREKHAAIVR